MTDNALPEWLKYEANDGAALITLKVPVDIDGTKVSVLRMREPDVEDQLAASRVNGSDQEQEVVLIANLCEVPPSVIRKLKLRDYQRAQRGLLGFID